VTGVTGDTDGARVPYGFTVAERSEVAVCSSQVSAPKTVRIITCTQAPEWVILKVWPEEAA